MFNKETEYALRALVYIMSENMKGRRPGISEISSETEAPHFYIAKILQKLVRAGLVKSLKGKGGGFFFDENDDEVTLKQLITITEGEKRFCGCGFGFRECSDTNPCPMHDEYAPIRKSIYDMVSRETIQSLAEKSAAKAL